MDAASLGMWGFGLSIVSALVPWVNGEVIMLSLAAVASSPVEVAGLVLLTSAGQMVGKCVLYWAGRGVIPLRTTCIGGKAAAWRLKFDQSPSRPVALVFVSSALGIPPFYLITLLAGTFRMPFGRFIGVGMCGRLVRFGLLACIPQFALLWLH
ncbi:MAG: hypothetical protein H6Q05_3133 [Acidobacteria bacterium]|jgi:membrane protein YqaA with SNARE-associated domain|nr:hypothetical protein [Acidobacteriota bacterium]